MRKARFISPQAESSPALYHIHSRCVDRVFKLSGVEVSPDGRQLISRSDGGKARDVFVRIMRDYAEFLGCRVNAFCVLSNHFHILLEVPPKKKGAAVMILDEVFLLKIKKMYSAEYFLDVKQMLERFREGSHDRAAEELKSKYTRRMYDLSEFMKGVKQRFTQWYNREHQRTGTLWEGRFKSVLVEDGYAARVMSAYIDLNPIRAGMVSRPEDYRWSSYGVAMQPKDDEARALAREGLCRVMQQNREADGRVLPEESAVPWDENVSEGGSEKFSGSEWYRMMLFADGEETFTSMPERGIEKIRVRKGFKREEVEQVLAQGGKLSFGEALRCRVRYMTAGMVFGSRDFVDDMFQESKELFGAKRKSGARVMREVYWKEKKTRLYTLRQLRKNVIE